MLRVPVLCVLCASCAATGGEDASRTADPLFPTPAHGLTIPARGEDAWTLERLLLEYGRASEQRMLFDEFTLALLRQCGPPLEEELVVAPAELHAVVEALLVEAGYVLTILRDSTPRIVCVESAGRVAGEHVRLVPVEDLERWRAHPAHVIRTLVTLDACDAPSLASTLRAMPAGADLHQILPAGSSHVLLVQGPGSWVAMTVSILRAINDAERARLDVERD